MLAEAPDNWYVSFVEQLQRSDVEHFFCAP
jgi:hypothetical protein